MATQSAQFEPFAWSLARDGIGRALRKRYAVTTEPPHLIVLISKLKTVESRRSSRLLKLVEKFDANHEQMVEARIIGGLKAFPDWFVLT